MWRIVTSTVFFFLCCCGVAYSQTDSSSSGKPKLVISGLADIFFCYDFNEPATNYRQTFLYNHNRHNEINVNLAMIKFAITQSRYRANIALQAGTYVEDNYSAEPEGVRNLYEANFGIALNKTNNLWFDVGILTSHIGFESAISKDNWTLTRSLLAENSPYYLTGAKLTFKPNTKWEYAAIVCNGWQTIQKKHRNSPPAFGSQIKYTPNPNLIFNWSTYVGIEDTGSAKAMRYYNNLYAEIHFTEKLGAIVGYDFGIQQAGFRSGRYKTWMSPVAILRYTFNKKWAMALRGEYYRDNDEVIISAANGTFNVTGVSFNTDFSPFENILFRIEGRWFSNSEKIFVQQNNFTNDDFFITSSVAVSF